MKYEEVVDYLFSLKRFGMKLELEPIKTALKQFGNPESNLKIVHVAGTNGKGSVSAMIASILKECGFRVGLFTSPHLIEFRERIRINDELITESDVAGLFKEIKDKNIELTYFEYLTLMALVYFKEKGVDYVVLETGLGGKLDATNIADSIISVLTPVSLDHIHVLGNTIEEIAEDKSEIIKQNSIVVTGCQKSGALDIIKRKSSERNCKLVEVKEERETNLLGEFQKRNAGMSAEVAKQLRVSEEKIESGLQKVNWPGRLQYLDRDFVVDCAHNIQGLDNLKEYIDSLKKNVIIVFGVSGQRNAEDMIKHLPKYKKLIFTMSDSANTNVDQGLLKAIDPETVNVDCIKIKNFRKALKKAKELKEGIDLILVTGSIYLVGDVMKHLQEKKY